MTLAVIVVIFVLTHHAKRLHENKKKHSIARTVLNQLLNFSRVHDYMSELGSKYNTYSFHGLFRSDVYTTDPANVECFLKTNFANYGKARKMEMLDSVSILRSKKVKDELILDRNDIDLVSWSCALINQKCHVKSMDIKKFL